MRKKLFILLVAGLLLAGCSGSATEGGLVGSGGQQNVADSEVSDANGTETSTEQPMYVLEFTDAVTTEGENLSADVFANSKLTMVNVWATFCGPCINEMPDLGEISAAYDVADFQLIGIVADTMEGDANMLAEAKAIIEETGADYPHLLLNEELYMNLVGASDSVPTTYFFNQDGELLGYVVGAKSQETWEEIIDGLLEEIQ